VVPVGASGEGNGEGDGDEDEDKGLVSQWLPVKPALHTQVWEVHVPPPLATLHAFGELQCPRPGTVPPLLVSH